MMQSMDDVPVRIPSVPTRFMHQLRAFMRSQISPGAQRKPMPIGLGDLFSIPG